MPPAPKPSARPGARNSSTAIREDAEAIAVAALAFLAEDEERLVRFLGETGMTTDELRKVAGQPKALGPMLDYILADESMLLVFAAGAGIDPARIAPAATLLAGAFEA